MSIASFVKHQTDARLEAQSLTLGYAQELIVKQLSLQIPQGKATAIVGPNGCGKSTLLAGLSRLLKAKSGSVLLNGEHIHKLPTRQVAQQLALLPQETIAPDGLTVRELIRFGRQPHQGLLRQWSDDDEQIVHKAIAMADLEKFADRPLESMSGGQRQRAWIAMAVAQATPLLLLDEPTSALDLGHQIEIFELIRELVAVEKTIVMVVHDLSSACRYADHIVAMRDGQIIAQGTPVDIITPALVEQLYDVKCSILQDPISSTPIITGLRRA